MRFCVMAVTAAKLSIFLNVKHRRAMVAHEKQQLEAQNVARSRIGHLARVADLDWRRGDQAATDIRPPKRALCGIVRVPSGGRLCCKDLPATPRQAERAVNGCPTAGRRSPWSVAMRSTAAGATDANE